MWAIRKKPENLTTSQRTALAGIAKDNRQLARLRAESARLLKLLKLTPQQAAPPGPAQAAFFEAPPWADA